MEITFTLTSTQAAGMFLRLTNTGHTLPECIIAHARELRSSAPQRAAATGSGTIMPVVYTTDPIPAPVPIPASELTPAVHQPAPAGSSGMFDTL